MRLDTPLLDVWIVLNTVVQVATMVLLVWLFGWGPVKILAVGTFFGIGLHPLGGRWIQEHFTMVPGQETYSYYGPLNRVSFNVGYHNEHHDLVSVPWSKLPEVRRVAHEFYDDLHSYTSWTGLLVYFCFRPDSTLFRFIVRDSRAIARAGTSAASSTSPS